MRPVGAGSPAFRTEGGSVTTEFVLKFAGVFLGVLARTLLPWLRKLREGQALKFDRKYLLAGAASLGIGFILTLVIFPQGPAPSEGGPGFEASFKLFCLAFGFGFGWNGIVLEGGQWALPDETKSAGRRK
jgi:hypothetical protein